MPQKLVTKAAGLYTNTNEFSESPEGSLFIADNVVIDKDSIIETRRGFDQLAYKFRDSADRAINLFVYQEFLLSHNSTDLMSYYETTPIEITGDLTSGNDTITSISPNTDDLVVGQTVIGTYVFEFQTVADVSSSLNNTYFLFNSAENDTRYYGWFNVDAAGVDPAIAGRTGVEIALSENDDAATVAGACATEIDALADFAAANVSADVTVTLADAGETDIARNGEVSPGFTFTNTGTGIPDGTVIDSIDSSTQITLSNAVTLSRTTDNLFAAGWSNYNGTYTAPDPTLGRIRGEIANENFYFVTNAGVKKLDAYNGDVIDAGGIKAIDGSATNSGSSGFQPDDTQVAYRIIWGYKDANDNLILGTPSERIININSSGGTRDVQLTIYIPDGVTVDYFYQIYRSAPSASASSVPNDELNLVYEDNPTSDEISLGEVVVIDNTPEDLRDGATIYTAPSQETILQANEPPPFAKDIASFRDSTFYANTKTRQQLLMTLLAVGGTSGINFVELDATFASASTFTVSASDGIVAGMILTGPAANGFTTSTTVKTVAGTTITVDDGTTLSSWGGTVVTQFRDGITISGVQYITNNRSRSINRDVSISIASPAVVTWSAHDLPADSTVEFSTTGTLPTGITPGQTYWVVNVSSDTFELATGQDGTSINTTGSDSGTHTAIANDRKFDIVDTGSPGSNIEDTSRELIRVINSVADNTTIYARYLSGPDDLPGQFQLEARTVSVAQFAMTATSHGGAWNPVLPTTGTTVSSTNDQFLNGLYFSKALQPEAVPTTNFLRVGRADKAILRIIPLREALFIFKEDGVYRLIGTTTANFRADLLDNTTNLVAPGSARAVNNQIFCLVDQGIAAVSDAGIQIVSRPIEDQITELLGTNLTQMQQLSFGVGYETDRKYILFTISASTDTYPTQAFVYNFFTEAWTVWTLAKQAAIVNEINDRLYLADAESNAVNVERKSRDFTDYVDDLFSVTLVSADDKTLTVDDASNIVAGDLVYQGNTPLTLVLTVDTLNNVITVEDTVSFVNGETLYVLEAINTDIEYIPETADNPGILKQFRDISLLFKRGSFSQLSLSFTSDLSGSRDTIVLEGQPIGLWGLFPWGERPWGGNLRPITIRTYIPANKQRCSQLNIRMVHREGYSFYLLNGRSIFYNVLSERLRR